jgi:hypothetical protein
MQSISNHATQRAALRLVNTLCAATLLAASAGCGAQTPPGVSAIPAVPPAPPVAGDALPPPPAPPAPAPGFAVLSPPDAGTVADIRATVDRFLINPDGDVDGFLTRDGMLVRFPPHLGAQLTFAVRSGDRVEISGWRDAGGNLTAQRISDARSGQQLVDQPPMPGTRPLPRELRGAGLASLSARGQVARVTTAPRGEPDGVILTDGTVIKLTPPVAQQFPDLLKTGASVSAQGYGTRNQYGTALQATAFGTPGNLAQIYDRVAPAP